MGSYRVNLDIFAGPLDLLLYLVRKEEVDIYDIPIANVTAQYVKYIEVIQQFDIDLAGDFLVMAASLMEIKSAMLLPKVASEDTEEGEVIDPRSELVRQLLEYKKFKDAANLLQYSAEERTQRHTRPDSIISSLKPDASPELDLEEINTWDLLEAFDLMMRATGRLQSYEHIRDDTPIDLYQIEMLHRLQTDGPMTFGDIFKGKNSKLAMVGLFLAMLELIRSNLIKAEQEKTLAPIYIRATTDEPAEQAVKNSIIAIIEAEEEEQPEPTLVENSATDDQAELSTGDDEGIPEESEPAQLPIPIQEIPAKPEPQRQSPVVPLVENAEHTE